MGTGLFLGLPGPYGRYGLQVGWFVGVIKIMQGRKNQALAFSLHHQSSLISIRCQEVTFPSRDNRNQFVYNSIKLCPVTTRLSSIFGSRRNEASFHARRRKSSRKKDTIKDIIAASIVTYILSFSFCHYVIRPKHFQALVYTFQVIYSFRTTSCASRIIRLLFYQPY